MRIMGIDYGTRKIGIALGDTETRIATPWRLVENEDMTDAVARLEDLAKAEGINELVVGVPQTPDGEVVSATAKEVMRFIAALEEAGFEVHEENEMLSSRLAAAQVRETGRKEKRDDLAAANILQSYLDRRAV